MDKISSEYIYWLQSLKVGSKVIIGTRDDDKIGTVTDVFDDYILVDGKRFFKSNGESYSSTFAILIEATYPLLEKMRTRQMWEKYVSDLYDVEFSDLPYDTIKEAHKILCNSINDINRSKESDDVG